MTDDRFLQTLNPTTRDLGGFKVHRTLPHRERITIGPFVFLDQMGPARLAPGAGIDVRPHPHINLATIAYLFAGYFASGRRLAFNEDRVFRNYPDLDGP